MVLAVCLAGQTGSAPVPYPRGTDTQDQDVKLPNGKSQKDEIVKAEHAQSVKDAEELVDLSQQLRDSLEKADPFVVSMADIRKTDDIEKLVKRIRGRLRRN